jgi:hypothetical protein
LTANQAKMFLGRSSKKLIFLCQSEIQEGHHGRNYKTDKPKLGLFFLFNQYIQINENDWMTGLANSNKHLVQGNKQQYN